MIPAAAPPMSAPISPRRWHTDRAYVRKERRPAPVTERELPVNQA